MKNFLRLTSLMIAVLLFASFSGTAQGQGGFNIVAALNSEGQLTTFMQLSDVADLTTMLNTSNGPFTVFAPTDAAFASLPGGTLGNLKGNPNFARQTVLHHIIKGEHFAQAAVALGSTESGLGKIVTIAQSEEGVITLNGAAKLVVRDVKTSNGILHVIDAVLSPEGGVYGGWSSENTGGGAAAGSGGYLDDPNDNPAYVSGGTIPYFAGVTRESSSCKGMTWTLLKQKGGSVVVGADRYTNPWRGDTNCAKSRPVLCFQLNYSTPPSPEFAHGWSGGTVKASSYIQGRDLTSLEVADGVCRTQFGEGWRMAEFHDGGFGVGVGTGSGWQFGAQGSLPIGQRFWVSIFDQNANPWDSVQPRGPRYFGTTRTVQDPNENPAYRPGGRQAEDEARTSGRVWCKGLTWVVLQQANGYVKVGADNETNVYNGDRSCPESYPMLCIRVVGDAPPASTSYADYSEAWSGGEVKASARVVGDALSSRSAANEVCRSSFGAMWRMAEFHDGSLGARGTDGWQMWARGNLNPGTRYWVAINDQRANPWNPIDG